MANAHCFVCGARITADEFQGEQKANGGSVVVRRYVCSFCATEHTIRGYARAVPTPVGQSALMVSRRQAADELDHLASAVANECGVAVPLNFLADLSQAMCDWSEGEITPRLRSEYQRIRELDRR